MKIQIDFGINGSKVSEMKLSDIKKEKLESWKQDQPDQQFIAILQNIIGRSLDIQELDHKSDVMTRRWGKSIQTSAEELQKLYPWIEKKW